MQDIDYCNRKTNLISKNEGLKNEKSNAHRSFD